MASTGIVNNMSGLSNLAFINGYINIIDNPLLVTLDGLDNLSNVPVQLRVVGNNSLTSIAALKNVKGVSFFLSVGANAKLETLTGLEGISSIGGEVSIALNNSLKNVDALNGISYIPNYLYISNNPSLTSVTGLSNLSFVGNYLQMDNNASITTLSGLENLANAPNYMAFTNSPKLSFCAVRSVCLRAISGSIAIYGNAPGCSSREEIAAASECRPLPVTLQSFTGKHVSEGNLITWNTSQEYNNEGFELMRSADAVSFETIAYIKGNGTSSMKHEYSFTDTNRAAITYYRLKQIDSDGKFTMSRTIAVRAELDRMKTIAYPNPVRGELFIDASDLNQPYSLHNEAGNLLREAVTIPTNGINTSTLQNGTYILTVGKEKIKVVVAN
ncbi:T9SS type A sorting domain-containing protein [Dyadobacter sandarakinus]|uniref:T9SS type A sorting domain-containing protein n=1 Tax=Dyadobacter sandarakinus TaxID=2747268 RepID=A0ABX7I294_9BACT|nr:T9SS type A sorting domain-containing protein [Dyadobacter sandarakinus]